MDCLLSETSMKGKAVAVSLLLCALVLLLAACEKNPPAASLPKVAVSQPVRQNVANYLYLTGNTQAANTVLLLARVEGYLEKSFFREGDIVKKGQLLIRIEQNAHQANLQQQEANVLSQKAFLEHAKTEYTRYLGLYNRNAVAQQDVENWRYQRDSAQAALTAAEAKRDLAKANLAYTSITAPFTGRIGQLLVDPGNLVGSGTNTPLAQLVQVDPINVYFNVSETDIPLIMEQSSAKPGQAKNAKHPIQMGLSGEEGYLHEGHMDFTAPTVTADTGTLLVRGVFPNLEGKVLPGQHARVRIPVSGQESALLAPRAAIGSDRSGAYVLVVNEKDMVGRRNIKAGAVYDDMQVVEEGLVGDEWVIIQGPSDVGPGSRVIANKQ